MKYSTTQFVTFCTRKALFALVFFVPTHIALAGTFSSQDVADWVNQDRLSVGLPALRIDPVLSQAAEAKVMDMVSKEYFAHTAPDGTTPWSFFEKAGYAYRYAGENLAIHFTDAKDEEFAWMASEKHRENILSPKYVETGIAVAEIPWKGKTTVLTVELFGTRFGESVADTAPWKSLSVDAPVAPMVSGVSSAHEQANRASEGRDVPDASAETQGAKVGASSVFLSVFLLPDISIHTLVVATLMCIGCLEGIAAAIVLRLFLHRPRLSSSRNITPM